MKEEKPKFRPGDLVRKPGVTADLEVILVVGEAQEKRFYEMRAIFHAEENELELIRHRPQKFCDIFWDGHGHRYVDLSDKTLIGPREALIDTAIRRAHQAGFTIRDIRRTPGDVKL